MDKIKIYRKCGKKWDYKYKHKCKTCNKERVVHKKKAPDLCKSCAGKISHKDPSEETRARMSNSKKGKATWNKGLTGIYSEEVKHSMGNRWRGEDAHNKGVVMSEEQKVKLSCTNQGIDVEDFKGFTTSLLKKERSKFSNSGLKTQCFENADYTCDLYSAKGDKVNAHHLDSWHDNEDKRFELSNLVCLSEAGHRTFHKIYGNKNNTKEQYEEFKLEVVKYRETKQDLFLVAGCIASGKSWVCDQLTDMNYISYDKVNKHNHVYELLKNNTKILLYDPTIKVSTFTKRYGHLFNIRLIVIVEDEIVINQRMISRGGKVTDTIKRRIKRMINLSKKCEFSGTSLEVFEYLRK